MELGFELEDNVFRAILTGRGSGGGDEELTASSPPNDKVA